MKKIECKIKSYFNLTRGVNLVKKKEKSLVGNYIKVDMKTFEELFKELTKKAKDQDSNSGTVKELNKGVHFIGKKVLEEAGEVWIAAEYEGKEKTAEEISQLFYHLQVMMIANKIKLEDVYKYL